MAKRAKNVESGGSSRFPMGIGVRAEHINH
jgi:hypothetical protein